MRRRLAAIMFTDMVGYSALAQSDEAAALEDLAEHNALLRRVFESHRGREVKTVGDAFLVEFESALDAVRCALEVQRSLRDRNAAPPTGRVIRVRIGVHVGDVEEQEGDVLGDAVNIASRIEPLAEPGGICLTQQVVDQVQNKLSLTLLRLPSSPLKNIKVPVAVYAVAPPTLETEGHGTSREATDHRRLAVLPLVNISPEVQDEYIADGLTEEIITSLSQMPGLRVIARTSVMPYKTSPKSIAQVGVELGVDAVLEGSVRKAGNRLRIALQLVDAGTQHHMWAATYNREIGDVFAVQMDIAERTADALRVHLGPLAPAEAGHRLTANPQAYDLYLRALVAASEPAAAGYDRAVQFFEQATRLDPTFAEAYAAWANLYVTLAGDFLPVREVMPRARGLAQRALDLDPESSEGHAALGNIALQFDHDWRLAETEFRTAISRNPSNVTALRFYGMLLRCLGRFDEAKEVIRRALRLDPVGDLETSLAWLELESGNFDIAIGYGEEERDKHPERVSGHTYLGFTYLAAGRWEEAVREADTPLVMANDTERFDHALLNALVGRTEAGRAILAEAERGEAKSYTSFGHLAMMCSAVGETDRAVDMLERDYREGDQMLWNYYRGVFFDPIRDDPRFRELLGRFGLPQVPVRRGPLAASGPSRGRFHDP